MSGENRNKRRYLLADSGQRIHPAWVYKIDEQVQEFLSNGGVVQQLANGQSAYVARLSSSERAAFCVHPSPSKKQIAEQED